MTPRFPVKNRLVLLRSSKGVGFTLIELLAVICILAILVALTVPVLQGMRKKSSLIRCTGNLRQIYTAFSAYLVDNNNTIFWRGKSLDYDGMDWYVYGGQETGNINTGQKGLFNRFVPRPLNPYLDNATNVFKCPCDTLKWAGGHSNYDWVGTSYNFNASGPLNGGQAYRGGLSGVKMMSISRPANTPLFFDASLFYAPGSWHGPRDNVCFLDGHLEALSAAELNLRLERPEE